MINKIPRVIHYCWFGGNPLPDMAVKCIESWKKYCPDCEIRQWDESNYDVNKCDYIKEAYEAKKWAFVSDYARYDILYNYGGLYFDTDVELIKPIDDILAKGSFMGVEDQELYTVNPGLGLAAPKGLQFYKDILEVYNKTHFIDEQGTHNLTTIVTYTTNLLKTNGLKKSKNIQCVCEINIYPVEYFCPIDYKTGQVKITNNTHSIHHFYQSWLDEDDRKIHRIRQISRKLLGKKIGAKVSLILTVAYMIKIRIRKFGWRKTIIFVMEKFCGKV